MGSYACTAETDGRGRCRNSGLEGDGDGFCAFHAHERDGGKEVAKAGLADVVLVRFNLNNRRWQDHLIQLGVPYKDRDFDAENSKHAAHAAVVGRSADVRGNGDVAKDSGVPVFGKPGLNRVSLHEAFLDLFATYEVVDMHIKPARNARFMSVLVVEFKHGCVPQSTDAAFKEVLEKLVGSCWEYVHVWANPPQADGRVIHTVNSGHHEEAEEPKLALRLNGGLWSAEKI